MLTAIPKLFTFQFFLELFEKLGRNLRRVFSIIMILGLLSLNVLSLTSSAIHNFMYTGLASILGQSLVEMLHSADSPTKKRKALKKAFYKEDFSDDYYFDLIEDVTFKELGLKRTIPKKEEK